jgi:PAS domain S-box-containing protein
LIALTWRLATQKATMNELRLQYDLALERASLERLVAERTKELNRSEQWHRSLFENATDAIVVLDRNGAIVDVNEKTCVLHGFPRGALIGTSCSLLEAGPGKDLLPERMQRLLGGEALVYETEHYRKDGTRVALEVSAKAICVEDQIYVQSFLRDITEKKRIQEHLLQSQKMESIGTLAGGIAHDFNNTLTAIIGYLDVIRRESQSNEKVLRVLGIMERAARSAGRMVSQLMGFARKGKIEEASLNVNDAVRETVKLMERALEGKVSVSLMLAEELPLMDGDMTQIEQVLMNLIVNARDAMPEGGQITFRTKAATVGADVDLPPYLPAGQYVMLTVTDTGTGIPDEVRERIFEPFFTTKERGKGTGLGLAMVYGVVTEHHGYLDVQSRPGEGTTFRLFFPESTGRPAFLRRPPSTLKGHETVLVVDDDETVLEFVRETLERNGYTVLGTTNPVSALDLFGSARDRIALVVTDIVMPLIDGGELIQKVRELRPEARVLTLSGFQGFEDLAGSARAEAFLQKPFDEKRLLTMVRRVLDSPVNSR